MTQSIRQRVYQAKESEISCEKVMKFLYRLGIHPDIQKQEFNYFYTSILIYMKQIPKYVLVEEIYQKVAQLYNTTWREVDRVINITLRKIWVNPEFEDWRKEITGDKPNKKMRNSQVIMFMAKYLI